jgi:transcriptional regulator
MLRRSCARRELARPEDRKTRSLIRPDAEIDRAAVRLAKQFHYPQAHAVGLSPWQCYLPSQKERHWTFPVAIAQVGLLSYVVTAQGAEMEPSKLDLLQGTLDLMVLQTLAAMGSMHGYGIARRIEQVSGNQVLLNQGTIYASLVRTEQHGWIASSWGTSDNNRKAKFYSITAAGRRQLAKDARYWQRLTTVMDRVLAMGTDTGEETA